MKGNLAIRISGDNPNHHLWNNNGVWFVHYTIHPDALTKQRIRCSLQTKLLRVARRKRDQRLAEAGGSPPAEAGCRDLVLAWRQTDGPVAGRRPGKSVHARAGNPLGVGRAA